jgi:ABC-type transport system substrate-binding protein
MPGTTTTTTSTEQAKTGGTLRILWSVTPASGFGWGPLTYGGEGFAAEPAMEPLLEVTFMGDLVPRVATGYEYTTDNKGILFHIRQGVKFHDGTICNADAVKYNIDAMIDAGRYGSNILSCDVLDDYTVRVNLGRFENVAVNTVASTMIASPTAVEAMGPDQAAITAVGTGPFKQVSYEPNVKIRLERFDDYWGQIAYLDAIEGIFIVDTMTQIMSMQSGEGDVAFSRLAKTNYDLVQAGFACLSTYSGMVALNPNSRDADSPFSKLNVRLATEYAINKQAIIDTLGYGFWAVAKQMPIAGQNGYISDLPDRSYDPDKAKQLLTEAGYGSGFKTKMYHATGDFTDGAVAIQADLADIGIDAEIVVIDWGKWGSMRQDGWDGIFLAGSGIIPDCNQFLDTYFRAGSTEMYSIARLGGLQELTEEAVTANPADYTLTQKAMRVLYDQCLWIPVEYHGDNYNYADYVHGINWGTYSQWGSIDSEKVWLSN